MAGALIQRKNPAPCVGALLNAIRGAYGQQPTGRRSQIRPAHICEMTNPMRKGWGRSSVGLLERRHIGFPLSFSVPYKSTVYWRRSAYKALPLPEDPLPNWWLAMHSNHPQRLYESRVLPTELASPFITKIWLAGQDSNLRIA